MSPCSVTENSQKGNRKFTEIVQLFSQRPQRLPRVAGTVVKVTGGQGKGRPVFVIIVNPAAAFDNKQSGKKPCIFGIRGGKWKKAPESVLQNPHKTPIIGAKWCKTKEKGVLCK
ncbi:MAG: hypothetical protein J6R39_03150 [Oscillospiraceae bacterium]|nr:hypothetical protein [Oscillospiraceae bacterium]